MSDTRLSVLTIAASDSGGGAGIQADVKTFHAHGVYGTSVITAVTSQNTVAITNVLELPADHIRSQLEAVLDDFAIAAVKTGALFSARTVEIVADVLRERVTNLVIDPVMVSSGGHPLLDDDAVAVLRRMLFPLARVVTPNIREAETLSGGSIASIDDMKTAARRIAEDGSESVLVKGGHARFAPATDVLFCDGEWDIFEPQRVIDKTPHGTGCTFSAAITARLARGQALPEAVAGAKRYVTRTIESALDVGRGDGSATDPFYFLDGRDIP